jgi:transposase
VSALYAAGDGENFVNGRHLSAWFGLVLGQHSTGGKPRLLNISKRGNSYLRPLLIHGERVVLRHSKKKNDRFSLWAQALLNRREHNKNCAAVANLWCLYDILDKIKLISFSIYTLLLLFNEKYIFCFYSRPCYIYQRFC